VPRLVLGLSLLGCLSACVPDEKLSGTLTVDHAIYGSWTMSPTVCVSGQHEQFFGVDLTEDGDVGSGVRILDDPIEGYSLGMNIPGEDKALVLRAPAKECAVFDIHLERGNTRINDIWTMQGHANIECRLVGVEIVADLRFSDCT
jgi:hypothetical protein